MAVTLSKQLRHLISPENWSLVQRAHQMMEQSKDPYHDHTHVARMVADFEHFWEKSELSKKVNPEAVLLSISWHDAWKSQRLAKNSLELLYHQWMDGLGSVQLFEQAAKSAKISADLTRQVSYAIRKHAQFQFAPVKTIEAQVLRDLDNLDLFSTERFQRGKELFIFGSKMKTKFFLSMLDRQQFHTPWAERLRGERQQSLKDTITKLLDNLY